MLMGLSPEASGVQGCRSQWRTRDPLGLRALRMTPVKVRYVAKVVLRLRRQYCLEAKG